MYAVIGFVLIAPYHLFSQGKPSGIVEPPEFKGEPKRPKSLPEPLVKFFKALAENGNDSKLDQENRFFAQLPQLLAEVPTYSEGYFLRALWNRCQNAGDPSSALADVNAAISTFSVQPYRSREFRSMVQHYSLRAKLMFEQKRYGDAMNDLELAMRQDLVNRYHPFSGIEPEPKASPCGWTWAELEILSKAFPNDYRVFLFRGLYLRSFAKLGDKFNPKTLQEFQKASALNPKSALPYFFIGYQSPFKLSIAPYTRAVQLEPQLAMAYFKRAESFRQLEQFQEAISDYGKVLEFEPDNLDALIQRGITYLKSKRHHAAISDFKKALQHKFKDDGLEVEFAMMCQDMGDAYVALSLEKEAIESYSQAIKYWLTHATYIGLGQIRSLYPEYNELSDAALASKLHRMFFPEYDEDKVLTELRKNDGRSNVSQFSDLYEKRGDAYIRAGYFELGSRDFGRIYNGIPNVAKTTDRWRLLSEANDGRRNYLDVKSIKFAPGQPVRFWIKAVGKDQSASIQLYESDCGKRHLRQSSRILYGANGEVLNSSDDGTAWSAVMPESLGEMMYNGACKGSVQ